MRPKQSQSHLLLLLLPFLLRPMTLLLLAQYEWMPQLLDDAVTRSTSEAMFTDTQLKCVLYIFVYIVYICCSHADRCHTQMASLNLHTCVGGQSSHQTFPLLNDACPRLRSQGGLAQLSRPSTGRSLIAPPPHLPAPCSNPLCLQLRLFTIQIF